MQFWCLEHFLFGRNIHTIPEGSVPRISNSNFILWTHVKREDLEELDCCLDFKGSPQALKPHPTLPCGFMRHKPENWPRKLTAAELTKTFPRKDGAVCVRLSQHDLNSTASPTLTLGSLGALLPRRSLVLSPQIQANLFQSHKRKQPRGKQIKRNTGIHNKTTDEYLN